MGLAHSRWNDWGVREGLGSSFCPHSASTPASGGGLAPSELSATTLLAGDFREALGLRSPDQDRSCRDLLQLVWGKAAVSEGAWRGCWESEGTEGCRVGEPGGLPPRLSLRHPPK